jgi:hypothetical protein
MPNANSINYFSPAKWVVSKIVGEGTHTTIAGAIASATSGDTIVVMPGIYSESNNIGKNLNIVGFDQDQFRPNVSLVGNTTFNSAVTCSIANISLSNGGTFLTLSNASVMNISLNNCFLNCNNPGSPGITFSASNAATTLRVNNCQGTVGSTSAVYSMTGAGTITFNNFYGNKGTASTTTNSSTSGLVILNNSSFVNPFVTASTGVVNFNYSTIDTSSINVLAFNSTGSGSNIFRHSNIYSGTAAALNVSAGTLSLYLCNISSTNATAVITGAGTVNYQGLTYSGNGSKITVTTQSGGTLLGNLNTTTPSTGFIGEQVKSTVASGSPVSLTLSGVPTNITSVALTQGVWSISGLVQFGGAPTVSGVQTVSVGVASATPGTLGDNSSTTTWATSNFTAGSCPNSVSNYVVTLNASATLFMVASGVFSGGTMNAYGRLNAIRIG